METGPGGAFHNMAMDEALAISAMEGRGPVLRLYSWRGPSVSIGRFQCAGEVDAEYLGLKGIELVRRPTGGRGIFHGEELTYSLAAPASGPFAGGLREAYGAIASAFVLALRALGLDARADLRGGGRDRRRRSPLCFATTSYGEITVEGRKVIGSAQRRWRGGFLQQGSIPLAPQSPDARRAFPSAEDGDGGMPGLLSFLPGLSPAALKEAVRSAFEEALGAQIEEGRPTRGEEALARELLEKYRSPEWNFQR
ncbi:MAG: lipoate--protein ligase family protein [Thermodesulfovibrionales bacterium]